MKTDRILLLVLVLLHFGLALAYAHITPFETPGILVHQRDKDGGRAHIPDIGAPDEMPHVVYVEHIASGKGFPVLRIGDPDQGRNYQSHQPPLFYLLDAGWSAVWSGMLGKAMAMRSLNAVLGGLTVVGVFMLAWWGTRRRDVALGAATIAALLPMNIALSGAVSNDPLLFCTCTWSLALSALIFNEGATRGRVVALGVLIGLAFLTKTTSLALIPALGLGWLFARDKVSLKSFALAPVIGLVLGGLWWARNQSLYGDPFALGIFNVAFKDSPKAEMFIQGLGPYTYWADMVGWWTARSFVGVFGYMDIFLNDQNMFLSDKIYRLILAVFALLGLLGVLDLSKKRESEVETRPINLLNGVFLLTVIVLFLKFNATYFQGQARYLFPAIGPLSIGLAMGLSLLGKNRSLIPVAIFGILLVVLNGYVLTMLPEEFARRMVTL